MRIFLMACAIATAPLSVSADEKCRAIYGLDADYLSLSVAVLNVARNYEDRAAQARESGLPDEVAELVEALAVPLRDLHTRSIDVHDTWVERHRTLCR